MVNKTVLVVQNQHSFNKHKRPFLISMCMFCCKLFHFAFQQEEVKVCFAKQKAFAVTQDKYYT